MDIRWRLISIASVPGVPLESTSASTRARMRASTRCAPGAHQGLGLAPGAHQGLGLGLGLG